MKNKKIYTEFLILLLILLVIISPFGSFGLSAEFNSINNNIEKNPSSSSSSLRIKSQCKLIDSSIITKEQGNTQNLAISSYDNINNIAIADTLASESYPSMIINGIDGLIAYEYQDGSKPFIYLRNTKNFGQSWSNGYKLNVNIGGIDTSVNSPSLSINPKNGYTYGAFLSEYNNSGVHGIFKVNDISNLNTIELAMWDWSKVGSASWWGFKDITIEYHNYNNVPWITSFIGSTNYAEGAVKNAVMYGYLDPELPSQMWIQWEPGFGNCSNLSVTMNDDYKKIYGVSEIINGSNIDLLYFSGSYKTATSGLDLFYYNFTGFGDLIHPKIYVKGDNIIIAVENNLHEIIMFNSTNNGNSWRLHNLTSDILPTNSNPRYPDLFANETTLYCTFVESGNISITSTSIRIINWTKPVQLNDINGSVVSKYRSSDMFDINNIVWTDTRDGNYDLYSYIRNIPEFDLKVKDNVYITNLSNPFLQTKNIINFTIVNLGGYFVENVDIKIVYSCINNKTTETDYPCFITYLNSGAEKSFTQYLFRINLKEFFRALISFSGIQNITITVDPDNKYEDKNLDDNSVTIQVTYKEIFPYLFFLETIFLK